jgi:thioredoxin reductase (NADPH)
MDRKPELIPDDVKRTIQETFFSNLKDDVAIEVYTLAGMNDQYNDAAVALVTGLAALSDRIKPSFHTVGDRQSEKRGVTRSPTVLVAPDRYRIRYTGAPLGEEGKSLLVAIMMASTGGTGLSAHAAKQLAELKDQRRIQVYVSPT